MLSHHLLVKSDNSKNVHKTNSRSSFTNELLFSIKTEANEKISLEAIGLSNKFSNVPHSIQRAKYHLLLFKNGEDTKSYQGIKLTGNNFSSASELAINLESNNNIGEDFITFTSIDSNRLSISIFGCTLYISKDLFEWLNLTVTDSIIKVKKFGLPFYMGVNAYKRTAKRINSSTDIIFQPINPKLIQVCLKEMRMSLRADGYHNVISVIPGSVVCKQPCLYQIKRKEYYQLEDDTNSKLSLFLLDENDFPLQIIEGPPTFLQFKLKIMKENKFTLNLRSSDSTVLFSENTSSNFKVYIRHDLFQDNKNYEVALSSIILPTFKLRNEVIFNKKDFYVMLSARQENMAIQFYNIDFERIVDSLSETSIAAEINRQIQLLVNDAKMPVKLIEAIKYTDKEIAIKCNRDVYLAFSELFSVTFDAVLGDIEVESGETLKLGKFMPERAYPPAVLLESNIAAPSLQADSYRHVLKIIPFVRNGEEEIPRYDATSLDFIPLNSRERIMHFQLRDYNEKEIPYKNNRQTVFVNLVFKEVK